jgi:hypothetical protein
LFKVQWETESSPRLAEKPGNRETDPESRPDIDHRLEESEIRPGQGVLVAAAVIFAITIRPLGCHQSQTFADIMGGGLHEAEARAANGRARENAPNRIRGPGLGRLAQISIDGAKPQGGSRETELPRLDVAADVTSRAGLPVASSACYPCCFHHRATD